LKIAIYFLLALLLISGCSEIDMPTPETVLKRPLGTDSIKIGMEKDQVRALWGEPDSADFEEDKVSGRVQEVWVYNARYSEVPVDAGYLSRTKYLYFDGNNLTRISE